MKMTTMMITEAESGASDKVDVKVGTSYVHTRACTEYSDTRFLISGSEGVELEYGYEYS